MFKKGEFFTFKYILKKIRKNFKKIRIFLKFVV